MSVRQLRIAAALLAASLTLLAARPAGGQGGNPLVTGILDKMAVAANNLRTLQATLRQQKINTQIGIKDVIEQGTLFYKPGKDGKTLLRIDYVSPDVKTVIVAGDRFQLYQPKINQALEGTIKGNSKASSLGFFSIKIDGRSLSSYEVSFVNEEVLDGIQTIQLKLTPREGTSAAFKHKNVWIDKVSWLPMQFQVTEKNNDVTWFRLNNVRQNVQLAETLFKLQYKSGTQIIKG